MMRAVPDTPALLRSAWGTLSRPVRASASILRNDPDGWTRNQDSPYWWLGPSRVAGWDTATTSASSPAVLTRALSLIADPIASNAFQVHDPDARISTPPWLADPMQLRVASERVDGWPHHLRLPRSLFWRRWITDAVLFGQGVLLVPTTPGSRTTGHTQGLIPLLPDHVRTSPTAATEYEVLADAATDHWVDLSADGYVQLGERTYTVARLLNVHHPDPLNPRGVLHTHPEVFALAGEVDTYTASTFTSGIPAGFLKTEQPGMTQEQADDLKTRWMAAHGTSQRSIAVLNASTSFIPLALNPVDAAVAEVKRLNIADVAFALGMSPHVLEISLGTSNTYANVADFWRLHRDFALSPWVDAVEGVLSALVPWGSQVKVDLDAHTRPDLPDRIATYAAGRDAGLDPAALAIMLGLPAPTMDGGPDADSALPA